MSWRVEAHDGAIEAALAEARALRVYIIGRLQDHTEWTAFAQNGKIERVAGGCLTGLGVQAFTPAGHSGFASTDQLNPGQAVRLVRRAASLAEAAAAAGAEPSPVVYELSPEPAGQWDDSARRLNATPQAERREALLQTHQQALAQALGCATSTSLFLADTEWRIVRSDGTDVRFRQPRGLVRHRFTAHLNSRAASAGCVVSGADDRVLLDDSNRARLERRASRALRGVRDVIDTPPVDAGNYRVVLDHSMAKSLAHEAFGHAVEADVAENSILATGGRLRLGERVARGDLAIVDGPLAGDYAYQPVSSNGLIRQTVEIVRGGVLRSGLGDLFSAARAGTPRTGACRAESFRTQPLPRMSNVRLVLDSFVPLEADPDTISPAELRERLLKASLLDSSIPTLLLAGHRGGQVSPLHGDFVFNCSATYDLSDGVAPRQPAVFSGKSLSALGSIVAALGDLVLDAPGHCVKDAQTVATSGGSHAFVMLERHPEVTVGVG